MHQAGKSGVDLQFHDGKNTYALSNATFEFNDWHYEAEYYHAQLLNLNLTEFASAATCISVEGNLHKATVLVHAKGFGFVHRIVNVLWQGLSLCIYGFQLCD